MSELRAVAFVSAGRWVARCPRPFCSNAEQFGGCQDGSPGGLGGTAFRCREEYGGCGLTCPAEWPPNVEDIEFLLAHRPVPATRNWAPTETLHDLLAENAAHGILPMDPAALGSERHVTAMLIEGDRIAGRELPAGRRLEIGG
jgi:hypothetical protein